MAEDKPDARLDAPRISRGHHLFDIGEVSGQRFLAEDVLPLLRRAQDQFLMPGGWHAYVHDVYLTRVDEFLRVRCDQFGIRSFCKRADARLVKITHRRMAGIDESLLYQVSDGDRMAAADEAATNQAD